MNEPSISRIDLHGLALTLRCDDPAVQAGWETIFAGFAGRPATAEQTPVELTLALVAALPPLPPAAEARRLAAPGQRPITIVTLPDGQLQIELPGVGRLTPAANRVAVTIARRALDTNQLEDITLIALAPLLRRHGLYMVHAFGVAWEGRALLLVGRSGSGKTTTGLNLVRRGWDYLANDVVLLRLENGRVTALAGPGAVSLTPQTLALLPALAQRLGPLPALPPAGKWVLPANRLAGQGAPAAVGLLAFPGVGSGPTRLQPLPAALALAHLMEQSVDSWDAPALPAHLDLLQQLVGQAAAYELTLGLDFAAQATLLAGALG